MEEDADNTIREALFLARESLARVTASSADLTSRMNASVLPSLQPGAPSLGRVRELLERFAAQQTMLGEILRQHDCLLLDVKARTPFACPSRISELVEFLTNALPILAQNKVEAFLRLARRNPRLIERIPGALERLRRLSARKRGGAAWRRLEEQLARQAKNAANRLAQDNTAEWNRVYAKTLRNATALDPLVSGLRAELDSATRERRALESTHEEALHRHVRKALAPRLARTASVNKSAGLTLAEAAAANQREAATLAAARLPWQAAEAVLGKVRRQSPPLSDDDAALVALWTKGQGGGGYAEAAMESARQAELAALSIYRRLYSGAEDLSILQVSEPADSRWRQADIGVDGRWIDVKNARRSFSSPRSYSEHCVPRFKMDRSGHSVCISAVLSPYIRAETPKPAEDTLWLGETSLATIEGLAQRLSGTHLNLGMPTRVTLLPPWLFDYPNACYAERDSAIKYLRSTGFDLPLSATHAMALLSGRFHAREDSGHKEHGDDDLASEAVALARTLQMFGSFSRPLLFLHVLERFSRVAVAQRPFPTAALRRLLFPPPQWLSRPAAAGQLPLAVCDPLGTISALVDVLAAVSETCQDRAISFDAFRLRAPGILHGRLEDGRWRTVIAYCGGWGSLPSGERIRCGRNPIFLGCDSPCEQCGRLVCHRCGFCSTECSRCAPRQQGWRPLRDEPDLPLASGRTLPGGEGDESIPY